MKTVKFKTNNNSSGFIGSDTPYLNEVGNIESWKVDTGNLVKILEVELVNED
jgi:copper chaperone